MGAPECAGKGTEGHWQCRMEAQFQVLESVPFLASLGKDLMASPADFYHPERYIRCGEEAARAALPQLKQLVRT